MKVTTDGCLFGAIVAKELSSAKAPKVLDIGAGTGLLSLMIAQQNADVKMDAIEIDAMAADQAKENIQASPWGERITVLQADVLQYDAPNLYDIIISNPPFYQQQLSSPNRKRSLAHHSTELTLQQLFQQVMHLLNPNGIFYVLLPFYRSKEATALARKYELFPVQQWFIKQTSGHGYFRSVFCFGKKDSIPQSSELIIKNEHHQYTPAVAALLQPFYLRL